MLEHLLWTTGNGDHENVDGDHTIVCIRMNEVKDDSLFFV